MPYDSTSKIITRPLNTADISQATAEGSLDVGTLCASSKINPFAKFKPINHTAIGEVTDAERLTENYGLTIPAVTDPAQLLNSDGTAAVSWSYPARTAMYRMFDFTSEATSTYGYYKEAPVPMTCVVPSEGWTINSLNEGADQNARVPFYAWFRSAVELGDKRIDTSIGINGNYNHTTAQLGSSISADELTETTSGSQLMPTNSPSRFGLALFTTDGSTYTYSASYMCTQTISVNSTYNNSSESDYPYAGFNLYANHCLNTSGTVGAITHGRYKAVPFLRVGTSGSYKYVPLAKYPLSTGSIYPCVFDFGMGMEDTYTVQFRLGTSSTAPSTVPASGSITTTNNTIYAYVYVTNNSPWTHVTNSNWNSTTQMYETIDRWKLLVEIMGLYNASSLGITFDRTNVATTRISPSSFTIAPNGTAVLVYRIDMLWSADGTSTIQNIPSGAAVYVGFNLSYLNTDESYTQIGLQNANAQTVYYG